MSLDDTDILTIGVSTRALFDLKKANTIFEQEGLEAYRGYQLEHESDYLKQGSAFTLIKNLLTLNKDREQKVVEVVIMSRNSPETGVRVFNSIKHYGLDITRVALTGGKPLAAYMKAFNIDLFLSKDGEDVQKIIDEKACAAAIIYDPPSEALQEGEKVKIAFDADAVIFSEDSEYVYKTKGMAAFQKYETDNEDLPLPAGPFAELIKKLSKIQQLFPKEDSPIRIAIVTSRSAPAHMRVIKTLREWGVTVDEAYFMGGFSKDKALRNFGAQIFFDDQDIHLAKSAKYVPSGRVPYSSHSKMKHIKQKKTNDTSKNE